MKEKVPPHASCQNIDPFNCRLDNACVVEIERQFNLLNILNNAQDVNTVGVPSSLDALSNTSGLMIAAMAQQAKLQQYNVPINSMHIFPKTIFLNKNHDLVCRLGWLKDCWRRRMLMWTGKNK